MTTNRYVIITPAKNEEANIGRLIEAVLAQTVLPERWIIVDDGSRDGTEAIVTRYSTAHSWIELISTDKAGPRDFGSKARAFHLAYQRLRDIQYEFIGNLDADVSFDVNYFEETLRRFDSNPRLGIAGGLILEVIGDRFVPQKISTNSVAGAVQLFRRACYEAIGGYLPIKTGGIDAAAEITARMHGWTVQTITDLKVAHHRRVSTGRKSVLGTRFYQGRTNYLLGYHPLFQASSCLRRLTDHPYVLGSLAVGLGFAWASFRRYERIIPAEVTTFLRAEQLARLPQIGMVRKRGGQAA